MSVHDSGGTWVIYFRLAIRQWSDCYSEGGPLSVSDVTWLVKTSLLGTSEFRRAV